MYLFSNNMNIRKVIISILCIVLFNTSVKAQQDVAVGAWKAHYNYSIGIDIDRIDNIIYYAAKSGGIACIDTDDESLSLLDKTKGLSDINIVCMRASQETKTIVICYNNSNIDLYQKGSVYNIPDLYNKQVSGDKSIYGVFTHGNYAYLACGFGIVVIDLKKKVITDSWLFRLNNQDYPVKSVAITPDDTIYAATDKALLKNSIKNPFIKNFATWEKVENISTPNNNQFKQLAALNNHLFVLKTDSTTANGEKNKVYQLKNNLWEECTSISFDKYGTNYEYLFIRPSYGKLLVATNLGIEPYQWDNNSNTVTPDGIFFKCDYTPIAAIHGKNDRLYTICRAIGLLRGTEGNLYQYPIGGPAAGGVSAMDWKKGTLVTVNNSPSASWTPQWAGGDISVLQKNTWSFFPVAYPASNIHDAIDIEIAPYDTSVFFVASFVQGLAEFKNKSFSTLYDDGNSILNVTSDNTTRASALAFDKQNNLWFGNWGTRNPLILKTKDNTWKAFSIPTATNIESIERIFIDSRDYLWLICQKETRLVLFNPNGTPTNTSDDKWMNMNKTVAEEDGEYSFIYTIAEGTDGKIWIGTDRGLRVYPSPTRLFENPAALPSPVLITTSRETDTIVEILLYFEQIRCIKVDAGNRKWVGTRNAGVYLFSPDGSKQLFHFTVENSPLISNTILSIEIDGETGEVFFGTDKGLVSFRYTATDPKEDYEELKIFPNPVRDDFDGYITITGLKYDSEVKITDAYGGLVYRTASNGGTASWDGKRFNGQKAATGVYFVFINDENGKERKAGKILFIK